MVTPAPIAIPHTAVEALIGHLHLVCLVAHGDLVFAVGGGTGHTPVLLCSEDRGHTFARWPTPPTIPSLRDLHVHVDDGIQVWVVGQVGGIAHTRDRGKIWRRPPRSATPVDRGCLNAIRAGVDHHLWIAGEGGLVLRARSRNPNVASFERVANHSTTRVLDLVVDGRDTWLLDSAGRLQRDAGQGFAPVPLAAMGKPRPLCALVRTPRRTLLLTGDGGLILRSTTDGASWELISSDTQDDLEKLIVTRYGIVVLGGGGGLLVSHDDGQSFQRVETGLDAHLWSVLELDGDLLIGGDRERLWRIPCAELAEVLRAGHAGRDPVLAELALRLRDGDEGAALVLDDALQERGLL